MRIEKSDQARDVVVRIVVTEVRRRQSAARGPRAALGPVAQRETTRWRSTLHQVCTACPGATWVSDASTRAWPVTPPA